jgi:hypothetical protein
LRQLSLRLMTLQDEERRRIARELHDTAGQTLAAIKMSIAVIRPFEKSSPGLQPLIDDLSALADAALQEVRTASYLLHPPLLDEAGIASAARWFTEGFSSRSGIQIHCEIPDKMKRPSREHELVMSTSSNSRLPTTAGVFLRNIFAASKARPAVQESESRECVSASASWADTLSFAALEQEPLSTSCCLRPLQCTPISQNRSASRSRNAFRG